jgi:hypothetical protein
MSRERFRHFMRVFRRLNHLDSSSAVGKIMIENCNIVADFMFSMCCTRLRFQLNDKNPDLQAFLDHQITESALLQRISATIDAPMSFAEFFQLASLMRHSFIVKKGSPSNALKQFPITDVVAHILSINDRAYLATHPLSSHSSCYCRPSAPTKRDGEDYTSETESANILPSSSQPFASEATSSLHDFVKQVHDHPVSRWTCNAIIILQFVLCVVQTVAENSGELCNSAFQLDPWIGCDLFLWYDKRDAIRIETAFNAAHFCLSLTLLTDMFVVIWLQKSAFFFSDFEKIRWSNIFDVVLQISIFMYDLVDLPSSPTAAAASVSRTDYIVFGVLRLIRIHKVLSLSSTITDTIALFRHLYPVIKAFFFIVYTFFFIWGILGMSLFSYTTSENGIALYPNKSQYISFFSDGLSASDYPNSNNPGNFGCNETDILGSPGFCGEYGPKSPLPYWDVTPDTPEEVAALDAAFVIGSGFDARVGGCFNLVGEAENRVLPCYCYYNSEKMNRTTSCDWINPKWYNTMLGQVSVGACSCSCAVNPFAVQLLDPELQRFQSFLSPSVRHYDRQQLEHLLLLLPSCIQV